MAKWPVAAKVMSLKGDMSYREFAVAVEKKTGKPISHITLRQLAVGVRAGHPDTIKALAEYSGHEIAWFYEEDPIQRAEDEAAAAYLSPTGDLEEDQARQDTLNAYLRYLEQEGATLQEEDYGLLMGLAKQLAENRKKKNKR